MTLPQTSKSSTVAGSHADSHLAVELPPLAKAMLDGTGLDEVHASMQAELEAKAEQLRVAILLCEPKQLIGYLWAQLLLMNMLPSKDESREGESEESVGPNEVMFSLEYVHAVLSSHDANSYGKSAKEGDLQVVLALSCELKDQALLYCLVAARRMPDGLFGPETGLIAMQALSSWVTIRGHRHQALEAEFFQFVLAPHDAALREIYGVGANEIAEGIQRAVDATRFGHMRAIDALRQEMDATHDLAEKEGIAVKDAIQKRYGEDAERQSVAEDAISGMLFGGICNLSKTSDLPAELLSDLSYRPGEEKEFFAPGSLCGTPIRRMPGRVKPLIALEDGFFTCDANFLRDSAYRAIQWGLQRRLPGYQKEWTSRQTSLTESAFLEIFSSQLAGAEAFSSIYYPDPDTGKWVENDVLILFNDVLLQLEVKAGVMPMHSPELHFERHVRSVQSLVLEARKQCERFLRYAASAAEVPIYQLIDGKHREVRRLRLADYRTVVPIGLTVEAFTPFSSMSKRLDEGKPILGKYPFVSMSIDDLFVLTRFLPTSGELMHYLAVRQGISGVREAFVFDEMDHLGSYIVNNRADMFYSDKLTEGASWLAEAGASDRVDAYFAGRDWQKQKPPAQSYPPVLQAILDSINVARGPRFLEADAAIRDMSGEGRVSMSTHIEKLLPTLKEHPYRWFTFLGEDQLLIWVQRAGYVDMTETFRAKAEAAAISAGRKHCKVLMVYVRADGTFAGAWARSVFAPTQSDSHYVSRQAEAKKMDGRMVPLIPQGLVGLLR